MSLLFAVAQAVLATSPAPATTGVVDYPPAFFAAAHPTTARDMLDRIPGFTFDGGESVRGYEGAAGNVLIDGQRPAAKTDSLDAILRRIPTSSVAHIEIIRGGATGVDMQGRSVIANVILKRETTRKFQVSTVQTYQPSKGRVTPQLRLVGSGGQADRKWEFSLLGGAYIDWGVGDGPTKILDSRGEVLQRGFSQSNAGGQTYQITGAYDLPLAGGQLRLNALVLKAPYDDDISQRTLSPISSITREHVTSDSVGSELGLRYTRALTPTTNLELVALRQAKDIETGDIVRSASDNGEFAQDSTREEQIFRGVLKQRPTATFSWEAGAEGALNTVRNQTSYIVNGVKITLPSANVTVTEKRYEAIAKAAWSPNFKWTFEADLRQELSEIASTGDTVLSKSLIYTKPRLAVKWSYAEGNQLRLRFEREVGQLKFSDFTATSALKNGLVTAGNPNLAPEESWVTELTSENQVLQRGAVVVTARHAQLSNVIDRAPIFTKSGAFDSPANIGSGSKDEVIVNATLPLDRFGAEGFQLQTNATWRKSEVTDPTTGKKRSISNLPGKAWDVRLTWDIPKHNLNLAMALAEEMKSTNYRFNQVETLKVGSFLRFIATWTPDPKTVVRMEMFNLSRQPISYTNEVYAGARSKTGLAYRDTRFESLGRFINIGVRRTF